MLPIWCALIIIILGKTELRSRSMTRLREDRLLGRSRCTSRFPRVLCMTEWKLIGARNDKGHQLECEREHEHKPRPRPRPRPKLKFLEFLVSLLIYPRLRSSSSNSKKWIKYKRNSHTPLKWSLVPRWSFLLSEIFRDTSWRMGIYRWYLIYGNVYRWSQELKPLVINGYLGLYEDMLMSRSTEIQAQRYLMLHSRISSYGRTNKAS